MGTVEMTNEELVIRSHIITYGLASSLEITERIKEEIETMWNEPGARVLFNDQYFLVQFKISAEWKPSIQDLEIISNTDPINNYFRIEEYASGNISFVDGIGCNSGYFKLENLYTCSTTAAHEYGHSLGAVHPEELDLRGKGIPGIMYPRGTLVDPIYQYEPQALPGEKGGTLNPIHRKVKQEDIEQLQLHRFTSKDKIAILGDFTNVWHDAGE